mmetsp:Transcript_80062/g.162013  ORF Transcript_80062/g.162013 Transcript_80062/m.162013 type:complete len:201 (+) Transcript_80062:50-652(+)
MRSRPCAQWVCLGTVAAIWALGAVAGGLRWRCRSTSSGPEPRLAFAGPQHRQGLPGLRGARPLATRAAGDTDRDSEFVEVGAEEREAALTSADDFDLEAVRERLERALQMEDAQSTSPIYDSEVFWEGVVLVVLMIAMLGILLHAVGSTLVGDANILHEHQGLITAAIVLRLMRLPSRFSLKRSREQAARRARRLSSKGK